MAEHLSIAELKGATIAYEGITTADGAAGFTSLIDTRLIGANDYVMGKSVLLLGGLSKGEDKVATAFDNTTGEVTFGAMTSRVLAGTPWMLLNMANVAALILSGIAGSPGLSYKGVVTTYTGATQFNALALAGFGNQAFANGQYFVFAFRDPGGAAALPQGEFRLVQTYVSATGQFTHEAFSVPIALNWVVLIIHQSQLFPGAVPGFGAFDVSSATVPRDTGRAARYPWEAVNQFKGMLLMPIMGDCRFISRRVVDYALTGVFTIDPNNPFPAATGNVEYLILEDQTEFVPAANSLNNLMPSDVIGNKTDTAIAAADNASSIIRYLKGIIAAVGGVSLAGKPNVHDVVIYPVAEDALTTELVDDGTSPAFYPAAVASTNVVGEGAAVAAWTEDINFEQEGAITIISIYAEFEWQTRFLLGAGNGVNSVSKIQISRDAGANWFDLTDNFTNPNAQMTARNREGVGLWIPTIVAGANQLAFRLLHWVDAGTGVSTSEAQIRSNSFVRITYRKS